MAGQSSRYPGLPPKWILTHPFTNNYMVLESIKGLELNLFDHIYFVSLLEHEIAYEFSSGFKSELAKMGILDVSTIILLSEKTKSQAETVYLAIKNYSINGFIFIKDSDGYFELKDLLPVNQVIFQDLNSQKTLDASSKSYITFDNKSFITNIVEKNILSPFFCVGGYGFESSNQFAEAYERISDYPNEIYISHIVYELLLQNTQFKSVESKNFLDWGTSEHWNNFKLSFKTYFVDIDGVIISNTSTHFKPYRGTGAALKSNIEALNKIYSSKKGYIVLTTSRLETERASTIYELTIAGVQYHQLVMNLPSCSRTLINDFSSSNPFPSASSVNILENNDDLNLYLP